MIKQRIKMSILTILQKKKLNKLYIHTDSVFIHTCNMLGKLDN